MREAPRSDDPAPFRPRPSALATLLLAALLLPGCPDEEPAAKAAAQGAAPGKAPERTALDPGVRAALAARPDLAKNRMVVLGLDGCDPVLVRELVAAGRLPNFRRLIAEGAYGPLRSQQPMLSPLLWTTVATGKWPTEHGVIDFLVRDPKDPNKREAVTSRHRQVESIWDIAGRYGRGVAVVGWLASHPAEEVNGVAVSERTELLAYLFHQKIEPSEEGKTWPPDLYARIQPLRRRPMDIPWSEVKPFLDVSEEEYHRVCKKDEFTNDNRTNNLRIMLAGADNFRRIGASLRRDRKPSLACHYFELLDAVGHNFMAYREPITWKPRELKQVLAFHRESAASVRAGSRAMTTEEIEQVWRRARAPDAAESPLVIPEGVDAQQVQDVVELSRGAEPAKVAKWKGAVDAAYEWTDRLLGEVMAEADPDTVLLVLSDHGFKSQAGHPAIGKPEFDSSFNSKRGGAGFHREDGVLGLWGKGVRKGFAIPKFEKQKDEVGARLVDIAPTVLALLGFPKAKDMPGRVLTELFDMDLAVGTTESYESGRAERLAQQSVKEAATRATASSSKDPTEEEEVEDAVRALTAVGYVGGEEEGDSRKMLHMAASYEQQERFAEAEEAFREALKTARGGMRRSIFAGIARMRNAQGDAVGARKALEESLKEAPDDLLSMRGMAELAEAEGDTAGVVRWRERIVARFPETPAFKFQLADALRQNAGPARGPELSEDLKRAKRLILDSARPEGGGEPDLEKIGPMGLNYLGKVLLDSGDYDGAVRSFLAAAAKDAAYRGPRNNLGVVHMRLGAGDLAAAQRESDVPKKNALLKSALAHRSESLRWFGEVLKIDPENAKAHYNRAEIHVNLPPQDLAAAEAELEAALKTDRNYRRAKALLEEVKNARAKAPAVGPPAPKPPR